MLTVVQFPIADARGLREDPRGRLSVPDWPSPRTNLRPQFVRHFGPAQDRRGIVDQAWADEHSFCRASRAITFTARPDRIALVEARFAPTVAFRRLFVDVTGVVARVEVGLAARRRGGAALQLTQASILAALTELLELQTKVADIGPKPTRLIEQGPHLARLYRRASTSHVVPLSPVDDRLVESGDPLVVVVLERGERLGDLDGVQRVAPESVGGASVAFSWFKHRAFQGQVGVWYIERGKSTVDSLRLLRLCLLRLHAERECLDSVLRQMRRDLVTLQAPSEIADAIQRYLNRATRVIARDSWNSISQSAIREAFDAALVVGPPDNDADLKERLELARGQVAQKVLEYAQQRNSPRTIEQLHVESLNAGDLRVTKADFTFKGARTVFTNRPEGPATDKGRDQMTDDSVAQTRENGTGSGAPAAGVDDSGGDTFTFNGQTTFINRPKDTVIKDFQNTYLRGDGSKADKVNEQLQELIALIHDSNDLPAKDKEDVAQAVTGVAEQVRDDKANGITVKGVLESVGQILQTAADIAPTAATIVASVIKIFSGI
jgi:hypothetical protein